MPLLLRPDKIYDQLESIEPTTLTTLGLRCLFVDIDNTLTPADHSEINPSKLEWLKKVSETGIRIILISNNHGPRIDAIAKVTSLETYSFALKPFSLVYRRILTKYALKAHEVGVIGDQLLTDILGGNLRGFKTLYVHPITSKDVFFTRLTRKIEGIMINRWKP